MSDEPFVGQIGIASFGFAPRGWALCNGQLLPINQNQALFSLLGTTYGGDGRVTFALPDLRGRVPIHVGGGHTLGERGGEQAHTLSIGELPTHLHRLNATSMQAQAGTNSPTPTRVLAQSNFSQIWGSATNLQAFAAGSVSNVGGSQAHLNMQPFLCLSFCIALTGKREILWHLLRGEQGPAIRQLGLADSGLAHISRAVQQIRTHYAESFRVEDLGQTAGMSVSAFHRNFHAVTGMSPIQFQKRIRLQEARLLLASRPSDVTGVGHTVGYGSPSQFSREYRRMFGTSPREDAIRLRAAPPVPATALP